ncbi:MAG: 23S rRNA (pseudouridine(1915)-N(3))-methyltransferase RlmH [Clostridia bacterium]|nr:23S rRNA (pseudouridine(1915)-N(3))-methyltransferase RlmH [Clostridia bacterium]
MLKVKIIAVGKIKEKYFQDAILEYSKRLSRYAKFSIVEVKEENYVQEPNESEKLEILYREGVNIKKELSGYVIAMCIEGKKLSSVDLAKIIDNVKNVSSEICFIIGGSYGIDESVKKLADLKLSISDMTFPHTLCRVVLSEQIYRAFSILNDGKYHK